MNILSRIKQIAIFLLGTLFSLTAWAADLQLRIIETGDVQAQLTDFNYDTERSNPNYGYTRTASLIKKAQREVPNSLYVDNGNILQGTPMGNYMLNKGLAKGEQHPSYFALEKMGAVASVVGRQELAYGLPYLDKAIASSSVPVLSANVFDAKSKAPLYKPYIFKILELVDNQGAKRRVNVAFIGFTPSNILQQQPSLQSKVLVSNAVLTAQKYVPLLKKLGAEVIIGLNHSTADQAALSKVAGLDAVLSASELKPFGHEIGVLDLQLNYHEASGKWQVVGKTFATRPIFDNNAQQALARNNFALKWKLRHHHQATRQFMTQPIGKTADNLYSYLSLVQDDSLIQLVNAAQKDYVQREVAKQPELSKLPVLSATSPYKSGKQHSNVYDYTHIEQGDIIQRQLTDLVSPSQTIAAVKINGAELKEWLECSAGAFNQIHGNQQQTQSLMNWQFASHNFDVIDGVTYQFDLSQPAKYNEQCRVINDKAQRVKQLQYQGKAVEPKSEFIVATHTQRALSGQFAGTGSKKTVLDSAATTRQIVGDYIKKQTASNGFIKKRIDNNWSFTPMNAKVSFETAASDRAKAYVALEAARPYTFTGQDLQGFHIYQFDLNK